MKIAFVTHECPPDTAGGGIGTYIREATRMLADRGHHVEVFAGGDADVVKTLPWGPTVHRVAAADRRTFPARVGPVFAARHKQVGFDVLEGTDYFGDAAHARRLAPDVPYVVKLHTTLWHVRRIEAAAAGWTGRLAARVRAARRGAPVDWSPKHPIVEQEVAEILAADRLAAPSRSIGAATVADCGADPARVDEFPYPFTPAPEYLAVPPGGGGRVVTFVGRLEIRKGVVNLARAIPLVLRARPDAKFRFVGGSLASPRPGVPMLDYLRGLLGTHAAAAEFLGRRPPEELPGLLADTAVSVFPSLWESFGFVCLEAMAAGRAVVASRACGLEELIDHGRVGRVIDPHSPDDIAAKLIELLDDARLRTTLGAAARERVLTEYAADAVGPQQEASYERAMARRPIPAAAGGVS